MRTRIRHDGRWTSKDAFLEALSTTTHFLSHYKDLCCKRVTSEDESRFLQKEYTFLYRHLVLDFLSVWFPSTLYQQSLHVKMTCEFDRHQKCISFQLTPCHNKLYFVQGRITCEQNDATNAENDERLFLIFLHIEKIEYYYPVPLFLKNKLSNFLRTQILNDFTLLLEKVSPVPPLTENKNEATASTVIHEGDDDLVK